MNISLIFATILVNTEAITFHDSQPELQFNGQELKSNIKVSIQNLLSNSNCQQFLKAIFQNES